MKILICGSRQYKDFDTIKLFLSLLSKDAVIVHGGSAGADMTADAAARSLGLQVWPFPAKWKEQGKAAGAIRNQRMLDETQPDVVVAFHVLPISPGTADMIARASKVGVPVLRIPRV